jgi:hypothetical protein
MWWKILTQHLSFKDDKLKTLFDEVVQLRTGHAILFSPTCQTKGGKLGRLHLKVAMRKRLTKDGGESVYAFDN